MKEYKDTWGKVNQIVKESLKKKITLASIPQINGIFTEIVEETQEVMLHELLPDDN